MTSLIALAGPGAAVAADPSLLALPGAWLAALLGAWLQVAFPVEDPAVQEALLRSAGLP